MSMKYKLVQRKDFSKDASPDSKLYYAQIVNNGTVDLKELCENIAEESALSSADVRGVFDRLTRQLRTHLQNGRTVVIDGFGNHDANTQNRLYPSRRPEGDLQQGGLRAHQQQEKGGKF